jgi:predicted transcriptional regulator
MFMANSSAEIRLAVRQVKAGHYIKHEDMKAWLLSWGTDHELPPKCVCGELGGFHKVR